MHKIVIHNPGGYDRLKYEEHPDPQPKAGEVQVRIKAAGINYADIAVRWGLYESAKQYVGWPITPGFEYAGVVEKVGEGVAKFKPNDTIFGVSFFGGYTDLICVPEHQVFPLLEGWSFEQMAGVPAVFLTAYHALFQSFIFRRGSSVLVHSAAGGVGATLCQLAHIHECKVVGVVGSSHKVETAKKFGATIVIDKSKQDLWVEARKAAPEGYDVVLDANGYKTLGQSWKHVKPTGKIVIYGFHSMLPQSGGKLNPLAWIKMIYGYLKTPRFHALDMPNLNKSIIAFNISFLFNREDLLEEAMTDLKRWNAEGMIQPPVVSTYPLQEVGRAHADIESGQTVGKLVLIP